jgi:aspartate aminotransferase
MPVAKKIAEASQRSSWIRQMFEEGARLAEIHGCDAVSDFSIGNPNLEPPREFREVLEELMRDPALGTHGYMSNAGYLETRAAVAAFLSTDQGVTVGADNVVMTCGAGGALNVIFKAILDPDDEVIVARPYFVEYGAYIDNVRGVLKVVDARRDFDLDPGAIEAAIGPKTRAVLVNSPNNPTGRPWGRSSGTSLLIRAASSIWCRTSPIGAWSTTGCEWHR